MELSDIAASLGELKGTVLTKLDSLDERLDTLEAKLDAYMNKPSLIANLAANYKPHLSIATIVMLFGLTLATCRGDGLAYIQQQLPALRADTDVERYHPELAHGEINTGTSDNEPVYSRGKQLEGTSDDMETVKNSASNKGEK